MATRSFQSSLPPMQMGAASSDIDSHFAIPRHPLAVKNINGYQGLGTANYPAHQATKSLPLNTSTSLLNEHYPSRLEMLVRRRQAADSAHQKSQTEYPKEEGLRAIRQDLTNRTLRAEQAPISGIAKENFARASVPGSQG